MNILVTGANGQLGNEIQLVAKESKDNYVFTDVCGDYAKLDITNPTEIENMVRQNNIECVVNCAAWTNVDKAETAGQIVETLNAAAPENLARAMKKVGGILFHISTDYVFGADPYNTPCNENQQGTPTTVSPSFKANNASSQPVQITSSYAQPGFTVSSATTSSKLCYNSLPPSRNSR